MRQFSFLLLLLLFSCSLHANSPFSDWIGIHSDSSAVGISPSKIDPIRIDEFKSINEVSAGRFKKELGVSYAPKMMVRDFEGIQNASCSQPQNDILDPSVYEQPFLTDSLVQEREKAFALLKFVEEKQRFTDQIDAKTTLDLPVGIKKTIGNLEYTIVIDSMVMLPTHSYLRAFMVFTTPLVQVFQGRECMSVTWT